MFVEVVQKNNGNKYLRLVQSSRVVNKSGYRVSQKKVILNIGPLTRFDDGQPDYVERLKKSFKAGNPLIMALPLPIPEALCSCWVRDCLRPLKRTYRFLPSRQRTLSAPRRNRACCMPIRSWWSTSCKPRICPHIPTAGPGTQTG